MSVYVNYRVESHMPLILSDGIRHRGYKDDVEQKQPWPCNDILEILSKSNEKIFVRGSIEDVVSNAGRYEEVW